VKTEFPEGADRALPEHSGKASESTNAGQPQPLAAQGDAAAQPQLSKEEQWALFEKELKESDWGHQPC